MNTLLQDLGRGVIKVLISFATGGAVGLLGIGIMATMDPDRWEYYVLDRNGPPFGPTLLAVGASCLATAVSLAALFFPTWYRAAQAAKSWLSDDAQSQS